MEPVANIALAERPDARETVSTEQLSAVGEVVVSVETVGVEDEPLVEIHAETEARPETTEIVLDDATEGETGPNVITHAATLDLTTIAGNPLQLAPPIKTHTVTAPRVPLPRGSEVSAANSLELEAGGSLQ